MQAISFERSNFAQTAVVSLATVAVLALLGLVLAYWSWAWLAPRPEPRAPAAAQTDGSAAGTMHSAYGLFGSRKRDANGAMPAGTEIRLLGVVAAQSSHSGTQPGYAVLRLDAKQTVAVHEGGDVQPGVRLAEVHAGRVVLDRNGLRETLALPGRNTPAEVAAPVASK